MQYNWHIHDTWLNWEGCCPSTCDLCWKHGGYHRRSEYLTQWLSFYIHNKKDVDSGLITMPEFLWYINNEAQPVWEDLSETHDHRCELKKSLNQCDCKYAVVMRLIWPNQMNAHGAKDILNTYKNLCRKLKNHTKGAIYQEHFFIYLYR